MHGTDWRRAAARRFAACLVLAVIGLALVIAGDRGDVAWIIGWTVIGLAGILATGFLFLEIGYSEDRERARGGTAGPS